MLRFCANLSTLFTDRPLLQRFAAAREAGFKAVELQFPYAESPDDIARALQDNQLTLQLHNLPPGDWAAGDRGTACDPRRTDDFRAGLEQAITYAKALGVPRLHAMTGLWPSGIPREQAHATLVANLRHAAERTAREDLVLMLEPLNARDVPGYSIASINEALVLFSAVGASHLKLQYDLYHAQRTQGELIGTLRALLPRIGHIQIADNPGRGEPGTGEVNWRVVFDAIESSGYGGWVGLEYFPFDKGPRGTETGLRWLGAHGRRPDGGRL
ncbi:MAG: hydroxypyruvate isomerase family protein [Hydrogenophaga sp.]|uniref:hydroxypyruvate isomerase family protein n=1 Tax=Hydrogenophaga sp. TaxID=1904254 RepID=UPI001D9D7158|nr:hydroxypyruvate isomerase family protein [Hydrogenophaga sp.]MBX3608544.1 hydroxypyruvate isomerase family protein [Hydrogenophaga sp.]